MREVPKIQQQPRSQADTAIHYGYCAFKDIFVGDRRVQPEGSPYTQYIPARELIPFTNLSVPVPVTDVIVNGEPVGQINQGHRPAELGGKADPTVVMQPKTAKTCAEELQYSYEAWGFKTLYPLTGFTEDDAFAIMQTIQPLPYNIVDLADAMETAEERINATEPYTIEAGDDLSVEMNPLSPELRETALLVLPIIQHSVKLGLEMCEEIQANTVQKMEQYYAGNGGKRTADPLDKYVFAELGRAIPTRLTANETPQGNDAVDRLINAMAESRVNTGLAEKEAALDAKAAQLDALIAQAAEMLGQKTPKYSKGDKVDVNGVEGTVSDTRFGRIKVDMPDGTNVTL